MPASPALQSPWRQEKADYKVLSPFFANARGSQDTLYFAVGGLIQRSAYVLGLITAPALEYNVAKAFAVLCSPSFLSSWARFHKPLYCQCGNCLSWQCHILDWATWDYIELGGCRLVLWLFPKVWLGSNQKVRMTTSRDGGTRGLKFWTRRPKRWWKAGKRRMSSCSGWQPMCSSLQPSCRQRLRDSMAWGMPGHT